MRGAKLKTETQLGGCYSCLESRPCIRGRGARPGQIMMAQMERR
jgi:hypothetical protein